MRLPLYYLRNLSLSPVHFTRADATQPASVFLSISTEDSLTADRPVSKCLSPLGLLGCFFIGYRSSLTLRLSHCRRFQRNPACHCTRLFSWPRHWVSSRRSPYRSLSHSPRHLCFWFPCEVSRPQGIFYSVASVSGENRARKR